MHIDVPPGGEQRWRLEKSADPSETTEGPPPLALHLRVSPIDVRDGRSRRAAVLLRRLALLCALFVAAGAFAAAAIRVPDTPVRVNAVATEVTLTVIGEQEFSPGLELVEINAGRLRRVTPKNIAEFPDEIVPSDEGASLNLVARPQDTGTVRLSSLRAPAGSQVSLRYESPRHYRVVVACDSECSPNVLVELPEKVAIKATGIADTAYTLPDGGQLTLDLANGVSSLTLTVAGNGQAELLDQFHISAFRFERSDNFGDRDDTIERTVSSLLRGSVYLEALGNKEHELQRGQNLQVGLTDATVQRLALDSAGIGLALTGRANRLATGTAKGGSNWKPSYLEVWDADSKLKLFFTVLFGVFGVAYGVIRFLLRGD